MSPVTTLAQEARQRLENLFRGPGGLRRRLAALLRATPGDRRTGGPAPLGDQGAVEEICARLLMATDSVRWKEETAGGSERRAGVFLFTGPGTAQGTSSVAAAVAGGLARAGKRTVLAVAVSSGDDRTDGIPLRESLKSGGKLPFEDPPLVTLRVPDAFLDLPEEARAPRSWAAGFDFMIVDAPAMPEFVTRFWVPLAHAVVLVVDGERTSVRAVAEIRDEIAGLGGTLAGVVLNRYRSRIPGFLHG